MNNRQHDDDRPQPGTPSTRSVARDKPKSKRMDPDELAEFEESVVQGDKPKPHKAPPIAPD